MNARLALLQRGSAVVLAVAVVVHLITIVVASRSGLTAGEILARTRGNLAFLAFYGLFVTAVAVHVPIGLRNIAIEWAGWRGRERDPVLFAFGALLLVIGWRAALAVFL